MSTVVRPPAPQEDQPRMSSPYRGLLPYREEDADYFFGRSAYIELVSANLVASRLTVLYAPSGVGKSSLLLAGVVHQMREMARAAVALREPPPYLPVVVRRWSGDPVTEVETAVAEGLRAVLGGSVESGQSDLPGLAGVFDAAARTSGSTVYAVFDQFEEMLLYHGDDDWEDDDGPAPELARLLRADEVRANFLIAIRKDSLADLDRFKGRVPGLLDKRVELPHLDRVAGREAIEQPLDRWNRRHRVEEGMALDPELTEAVLDQVATGAIALDRAGGGGTQQARGSIEAPFLQLVMERIWEEERAAGSDQMRRSTLDGLGGATEIVRTHLDRQMEQLSDEEQDVAAAVFHRLVTPSGAKVALGASDLAEWTGIGREALERVLGELAQGDWRIVRAIDDPARPGAPLVYEIYHDVLAEAVLDWRLRHEQQRGLARQKAEARRRWLRRLRLGLFVAGTAVAVVIAALGVIAVKESREARDQSRIASSRELAATARAQLGTDPELGILLAGEALDREPTAEAIGALRAGLAADRSLAVLDAGGEPLRDLDVAPDGKRILAFGDDGRLRVWRLRDRATVLDERASQFPLNSASFSPDGARILSADADGVLAVWSATDGRRLVSVDSGGPSATSARWDPRGRRFVAVADGAATVWTASGRRLATLRAPRGAIVSARWEPRTGGAIVTAGDDGAARLWNVRQARMTASLATGAELRDARFSDQGSRIVTIGQGASVAWVWTPKTGHRRALEHPPQAPGAPLLDATFDHSGTRIATAGLDHRVRIWSVADGRIEAILTGHGSYVNSIAFSRDNTTVATAGNDRTARTWNAVTGEPLSVLRGHDAWISGLAFPNGELVATAGTDGDVRLWRTGETQVAAATTRAELDLAEFSPDGAFVVTATETGVELQRWRSRQDPQWIRVRGGANTASLSPDGELLVVGAAHVDNPAAPAVVLRTRDGRLSGRPLALDEPKNGAVTAAFSPDGSMILTGHRDGAARLWSAETHRVVRRLGPVAVPSERVALIDADFSDDGRRVATVGTNGMARVFDARTGRQLKAFAAAEGKLDALLLHSVAIQPGGRMLATAGEGGSALWDLRTGMAWTLHHDDAVSSVAFSPDGAIVATASWDHTARLWDARTAQPLGVLAYLPDAVASVAFSPDGRKLVTADWTDTVRVFACRVCGSPRDLRRRAREQVARGLTRAERIAYLGADDG